MSIHKFTRVPVRNLKKSKEDTNALKINPFSFMFMLLGFWAFGIYCGLTVQAAAVQTQCSTGQSWMWESRLFESPLAVECKPIKKA